MTKQELQRAIDLLNNSFKNKIMKPVGAPIKEFIAAPRYADKFITFQILYMRDMGNATNAHTLLANEPMMIYAVFNNGIFPNYNTEDYSFLKVQDFFVHNGINPQDLIDNLNNN